jgi:autotransporter-associated beta strand protein
MFSDFPFYRRTQTGNRLRSRRPRRQRRKLLLERLEDRRLLAAFSESGATLNLVLGADESLSILSTPSDTYRFMLTTGGTFSGTNNAHVIGNGTNLLTVTSAGKTALDTIRITDSAAVANVLFADSGGNAYSDNFLLDLDNAGTTVTFQGNSSFGTSNLAVTTLGNIVLAGVSPVGQVAASDGNIDLSANAAGTAAGSFTGIRLAAGSSLTSTGTGHIRLTGRGAGASADTFGIALDAGAVVRSTSPDAGAGTITLDGTGGSGSNNDGVRVSGSNAGVKSVAGDIQITGTAPSSGVGIHLQSTNAVQSTGLANVVLIADGANLTGTSPVVAATASNVVLRPKTAGTPVGLGAADAPGLLGLTDAELDRITAATVQIGDATSGEITVSAAISHSNSLVLATGAGLTFQQRLTVPSSKTLTLRTGAVTSASGDAVDVQAGTLWLDTLAAVGAVDNPLTVALDKLRGTVGGDLFIRENDGVLNKVEMVGPLSAGSHTIHLVGGQFILAAADLIDDNSRMNVNGGTFDLGSWQDTVGGLTLTSGQITGGGPELANGRLTSATTMQVESGTIGAKLAGSVGLNKTTSGLVTLTADNTYTGATTITAGVLSISKDSGLGTPPASPTSNHLVIDGGTLRWTGFLSVSANRGLGLGSGSGAGTGTIDVASGGLTYDGVIADRGTGTAQLIKTGPGTLTLGGVNAYSGGTVIDQGELRLASDRALGTVPVSPVADHLQLRGVLGALATFELAANRGIVLGDPTGSGVGTIAVATNRTLTYNGLIADSGSGPDSLAKRGLGTLVLGGDSTFSGGTDYADLNSGVIRIDHVNGLGITGTIRFPGSGTLRYGAGITIDLSSRIVVGLPSVRTMVDTNGNGVAFASPLAGGGRFEKWGAGRLSLTFPGTTELFVVFVKGGELAVPLGTLRLTGSASESIGPDTYGPASLLVDDATISMTGGTLQAADSLLIGYLTGPNGRLNVTGGQVQVGGDLSTGDGVPAMVNISGATTQVTVAGDFVAGNRGGNPTVNLSGGMIQISGHFTVGDNSSPTVNISGGTVSASSLRHLGRNHAIVNLTGGTVNVAAVYHETANDVANDSLTVNLDAGGLLRTNRMYLNRTGGTQPQVTHTFALRFDGGTLKPLSADVVNLIDQILVAPDAGGTLIWEGVIEDGGALIDTEGFDANILRPLVHDAALVGIRDGGLTKQGAGTLTLGAVNTFTGPVRLTADTLALVNTASNNLVANASLIDVQFTTVLDVTGLDNGSVTGKLILADGQTLKGTGTVKGQLTAAGGATVAPGGAQVPDGGSPGILIQEGHYTMDSGSSLNIEFGGTTAGNSTDNHGQIDVTGEVRLNGGTFNGAAFNGFVPQQGDRFVIINNDGTDRVIGTFTGLPEGAILPNFLNSGRPARISYAGGTGNDVVISFDITTGIRIKKYTVGQDANSEPGPLLPVGSTVFWSYEVTSTGNSPLSNVVVSDNRGVTIDGPAGDANLNGRLDPGEIWTYIAYGTVIAGQYSNIGTATAIDVLNQEVIASDPSHYFGYTPMGIRVEKHTNGEDADNAPGPLVAVGSPVTWTYTVTSTGNTPLSNVTVTDNRDVWIEGPVGDVNANRKLDPTETWTYTARGVAVAGQYSNTGTATAVDALIRPVNASDLSHYFGYTPTGIRIEKSTNGEDADDAPGPLLAVGVPVAWTYVVTNRGNTPLASVTVTDDQGVTIAGPTGDANNDGKLDPGETWTYTASGTAVAGQYANTGTATATDVLNQPVSGSDLSHYFGYTRRASKLKRAPTAWTRTTRRARLWRWGRR